jgi:hypothetical protein
MYGTFPRFRLRGAILACVTTLIGFLGPPARCAEPSAAEQPVPPRDNRDGPAKADKSPMVWDGPQMRQIEKEWSAMTVPPGTTAGNKPLVRERQLEALLKKRLPKEDISKLVASMRKIPIDDNRQTEFQWTFIRALETILFENGDREDLVTLFSTHFDNYFLGSTTEYVLVVWSKNMKDPVLVLAEAYERSKDPVIRKRIATAVHQSFDGVGVQGKDDAEFIANAMKWFKDNKDRLVLNPRYGIGYTAVYPWRERPLYYIKGEKQKEEEKK